MESARSWRRRAAKSLGLDPSPCPSRASPSRMWIRAGACLGPAERDGNLGAAAHIWTYGDLVYAMHDVAWTVVTPESTPGEIAGRVKEKQDLVAALDAMTVCAFSSYACCTDDYASALELRHAMRAGARASCLRRASESFHLERQYNADLRHWRRVRHASRALPPPAGPDRPACWQVRDLALCATPTTSFGVGQGRTRSGSSATATPSPPS